MAGIKEGFRIGFSGEAKGLGQCSNRNMLSAREHPGVVDDYLMWSRKSSGPTQAGTVSSGASQQIWGDP